MVADGRRNLSSSVLSICLGRTVCKKSTIKVIRRNGAIVIAVTPIRRPSGSLEGMRSQMTKSFIEETSNQSLTEILSKPHASKSATKNNMGQAAEKTKPKSIRKNAHSLPALISTNRCDRAVRAKLKIRLFISAK